MHYVYDISYHILPMYQYYLSAVAARPRQRAGICWGPRSGVMVAAAAVLVLPTTTYWPESQPPMNSMSCHSIVQHIILRHTMLQHRILCYIIVYVHIGILAILQFMYIQYILQFCIILYIYILYYMYMSQYMWRPGRLAGWLSGRISITISISITFTITSAYQ